MTDQFYLKVASKESVALALMIRISNFENIDDRKGILDLYTES